MNAATILGGPALVTYRGASFESKGDIKLESSSTVFDIEVDRLGKIDERTSDEMLKVSFQPSGRCADAAILNPYAGRALGSLITPESLAVEGIDTESYELTITGHAIATGESCLVHVPTGGTLPTSVPALSNATRYYVKAVDANNITLHTSLADSLTGTDPVAISAAGTGTLYVDVDHPLVIQTQAGIKLTLFNAAITKQPGLHLSAVKTIFEGKSVEFTAFLSNGSSWSDANARWKIENNPCVWPALNPADIVTAGYTAAWGGSAPWNAFETKEGFDLDFPISLDPVTTDRNGIVSMRLKLVEASAKAQPMGLSENDVLAKRLLQGEGARRGRSLSGDDLVITCDIVGGLIVTITGAALKASPQSFSSATDRTGQLDWSATREFAEGVARPLYSIILND